MATMSCVSLKKHVVIAALLCASRAHAQGSRIYPAVTVGLSFQPDATASSEVGPPARFQISPVGLITGLSLRLTGAREIGVVGRIAWFPLLMSSTVSGTPPVVNTQTGQTSQPGADAPESLLLGSLGLETALGHSAGRSWSWIGGVGATHAFLTPRSTRRTAPTMMLGFLHPLTGTTSLRGSLELTLPAIGKTFGQVPLVVDFQPRR